mmetsp:Transcript_2521/g.7002  ORF Transcript_2521/g.7002 Transcript_2521/m.7002 type:complete len:87 (-) Transcript_2521:604-864(-)
MRQIRAFLVVSVHRMVFVSVQQEREGLFVKFLLFPTEDAILSLTILSSSTMVATVARPLAGIPTSIFVGLQSPSLASLLSWVSTIA